MWIDVTCCALALIGALGVWCYRLGEKHGREEQIELMAVQCAEGCMINEGEYER